VTARAIGVHEHRQDAAVRLAPQTSGPDHFPADGLDRAVGRNVAGLLPPGPRSRSPG
jgi:hypothetical protein